MEHKHKVYNLIILDESGSMQSIKNTIINGFNEVVQTIKSVALTYPEQEHTVTLVSFNSVGIKQVHKNSKIECLNTINERLYQPSGFTPLFDAMGASIIHMNEIIEKEKDFNVLVTILTDGEENASKEHSAQSIKAMVEAYKLKNWTFTYIGANHDVDLFASRISINNTLKFETNEEDMKKMFERDKDARMSYSRKIRNYEDVSDGYFTKTELDEDLPFPENKKPEQKSFWEKIFG